MTPHLKVILDALSCFARVAVTLQLFLAVVAKAALQLRAFAFGHVHG